MWQLLQKFIHVIWGNEQFFNALCEAVWILGDHQQPILCASIAHESIPVVVLLKFALFNAADLLETEEQTVVDMTGRKMDPNSLIGNNVGCGCSEKLRIPIENREPNDEQKDLPEA